MDYEIDSLGRVTKVTDAFGRTNSTVWNADDKVLSTTNGATGVTTNLYGANNGESMTESTDPTGVVSKATFGNTGPMAWLSDKSTRTGAMSEANSWTGYGYNRANGRFLSATNMFNGASSVQIDNPDGTTKASTMPENITAAPQVLSKSTQYSYVNRLLTLVDAPADSTLGNQEPLAPGPLSQIRPKLVSI